MSRGLALIAACLVLVGGAPANAEKVIFAWPSAINSGIGPMTFAMELGFFREEGIEPEVVVLQGAGVIIPQLMSGEVFSGYMSIEPLPISRQPGKPNFQFKFVYNYQRRSIWEIAVLDASPIKEVKDLAGKTIGVGGLTWGNVPTTRAILKRGGVDPASVSLVAVGTGVPAFEAVKRGQVDALNLFDTMHAQLDQMGTKMRRLQLPPDLADISSHGLPATDKMIKERPDLVAKFGRAMAKGTVACAANMVNCVQSYWKVYPAMRPSSNLSTTLDREVSVLKSRVDNLTFFRKGEPRKFGAYADADWTGTIEALKLGDQIDPSVQIDPKSLYTNQFVEQFNAFDVSEVERKANAYAP